MHHTKDILSKTRSSFLRACSLLTLLAFYVVLPSCDPKTDESFNPGGDSTGGPVFSAPYQASFELNGNQRDFNTVVGNDIERLYASNEGGNVVVNDSVNLSLGTIFFQRLTVGTAAGQKNQTLSILFRKKLPLDSVTLKANRYIFRDSTQIDGLFLPGTREYLRLGGNFSDRVSLVYTDTALNAYYSDSSDNRLSTFTVTGSEMVVQRIYGYSQKVTGTFNTRLYSPALQDSILLSNGIFTGIFTNFRDAYTKQ